MLHEVLEERRSLRRGSCSSGGKLLLIKVKPTSETGQVYICLIMTAVYRYINCHSFKASCFRVVYYRLLWSIVPSSTGAKISAIYRSTDVVIFQIFL
jgi:hypothetical protein